MKNIHCQYKVASGSAPAGARRAAPRAATAPARRIASFFRGCDQTRHQSITALLPATAPPTVLVPHTLPNSRALASTLQRPSWARLRPPRLPAPPQAPLGLSSWYRQRARSPRRLWTSSLQATAATTWSATHVSLSRALYRAAVCGAQRAAGTRSRYAALRAAHSSCYLQTAAPRRWRRFRPWRLVADRTVRSGGLWNSHC